jgi:hypothetical protein
MNIKELEKMCVEEIEVYMNKHSKGMSEEERIIVDRLYVEKLGYGFLFDEPLRSNLVDVLKTSIAGDKENHNIEIAKKKLGDKK